jgi:hypothetical protein
MITTLPGAVIFGTPNAIQCKENGQRLRCIKGYNACMPIFGTTENCIAVRERYVHCIGSVRLTVVISRQS